MILIAKQSLQWLSKGMKNSGFSVKEKLVAKYLDNDLEKHETKSTNINILLNRVKVNQKNEIKKKIYFSAAASTCLVLFGVLIF
tara:strand:+ start:127 stop:378 length:252 start_codon:yes stop_codon:yes gene_type:complete